MSKFTLLQANASILNFQGSFVFKVTVPSDRGKRKRRSERE